MSESLVQPEPLASVLIVCELEGAGLGLHLFYDNADTHHFSNTTSYDSERENFKGR